MGFGRLRVGLTTMSGIGLGDRNRRTRAVETHYERLPEFFCIRYDEELQRWGRGFREIGPVKGIVLKEGPFAEASPNPEVGPVLIQVRLLARMSGPPADRVTVEPLTERDEEQIRKHCEKLVRLGVGPRQFWKEAPRLWVPGMPRLG